MLARLRHPNVCLFMGVAFYGRERADGQRLEPPPSSKAPVGGVAIVTELAARGSLWDALRAPLPKAWQHRLAHDDDDDDGGAGQPAADHGLPGVGPAWPAWPRDGTAWPWALVSRVLRGTACGMRYLHAHSPPVIHRDLKVRSRARAARRRCCAYGRGAWRAHAPPLFARAVVEFAARRRVHAKARRFRHGETHRGYRDRVAPRAREHDDGRVRHGSLDGAGGAPRRDQV